MVANVHTTSTVPDNFPPDITDLIKKDNIVVGVILVYPVIAFSTKHINHASKESSSICEMCLKNDYPKFPRANYDYPVHVGSYCRMMFSVCQIAQKKKDSSS